MFSSEATGAENMDERDYICKISLVVANEKDVFTRQIREMLHPAHLNPVHDVEARVGHQPGERINETFDKC